MKLFVYEWKKMLFYQRGWLVILLALALRLGFLALTDAPEYTDIELYRDAYLYYLTDAEGELTVEKENFIENAATQTAAAGDALKQTYLDFYAGELSEAECEEQVQELGALSERYQGMTALYEQYLYVRQEPGNRYLVYPNGWAALLQADETDFFLLGALLLLLVPLFCRESACGMDVLVMTTAKGSDHQGIVKGSAALLSALTMQLLFCMEHLLFCIAKYGLPDADYPLQSLEAFSGCPYAVSLGQAFFLLTALRLFGAVFLAALICFAAAWTRRYAASCFLILCMIAIPYLAFGDSLQYRLPLPLGFLRAAGYLMGDEIVTDASTGEETVAFSRVSGAQLLGLGIVGGLIILLCIFSIGKKSRNKILRRSGRKRLLPAVWLACLSVVTGCGDAGAAEQTDVFYNLVSADFSRKDDTLAVQSPFRTDYVIGDCIYSDSGGVYYLAFCTEDESNIRLSELNHRTTLRVMTVSADTLEEDCIFEISYQKDSEWDFLDMVRGFFLNDRKIWFVTYTGVWQANRLTRQKELLDIPASGNIAFDGTGIYFIDETMRLARYDTETGETAAVGEIAAEDFVLTPYGIYFSNLRDNESLYRGDLDGAAAEKTDEGEITSLTVEGNLLEYYFYGDNTLRTLELGADQ